MRIENAVVAIAEFLNFIKNILNELGITSLDEKIDAALAKLQ